MGYYSTLKTFTALENGVSLAYVQTLEKAVQKVYRIDLETGKVTDLGKNEAGKCLYIQEVLDNGLLLGKVSTHNYHSFFYSSESIVHELKPLNS